MYLLVYVDDIILVYRIIRASAHLFRSLGSEIAIKDLGPPHLDLILLARIQVLLRRSIYGYVPMVVTEKLSCTDGALLPPGTSQTVKGARRRRAAA